MSEIKCPQDNASGEGLEPTMELTLSDRILNVAIGFTDTDRKQGIMNLAKECEQLECENAHLFGLLKSVYFAVDGSSEGLPFPAEVWDSIENIFAVKSNSVLCVKTDSKKSKGVI